MSLLFEVLFVLGEDCVVNDVLEDLDDEVEVEMSAFDEVAVFVVGFTVGHKHPETLHDFAFRDHLARVRLGFIPNVLRYAFKQLQVLLIRVEALLWVLFLWLLGQLCHGQLMVLQE